MRIPVAKMVSDNQIIGVALYNPQKEVFNLEEFPLAPVNIITPEEKKALPDYPTWGVKSKLIVLVAKKGEKYVVYNNGKIKHIGIDKISAALASGYKLVNAKYIVQDKGKDYLRLNKGVLYDLTEVPSLYADSHKRPAGYCIDINAVVDYEECGSRYFFRTKKAALACYTREIKDAKANYGSKWNINKSDNCFEIYADGEYCSNHIAISFSEIKFEDESK